MQHTVTVSPCPVIQADADIVAVTCSPQSIQRAIVWREDTHAQTHTAQIDILGDLCCSRAYPPLLYHNNIQWVQQSDLYVSLEEYYSTSCTTSPLSLQQYSTTLFGTTAEQGKSILVQSSLLICETVVMMTMSSVSPQQTNA
jgi:hypothetical protein